LFSVLQTNAAGGIFTRVGAGNERAAPAGDDAMATATAKLTKTERALLEKAAASPAGGVCAVWGQGVGRRESAALRVLAARGLLCGVESRAEQEAHRGRIRRYLVSTARITEAGRAALARP
jgi:hypothetical protein